MLKKWNLLALISTDNENLLEKCYHVSDKDVNETVCKFKLEKLIMAIREKELDEGGYGIKTDRTQGRN